MTGFELLEKLPNSSFDLIFVTAYGQYAIRAFAFSAISYLLKPVDGQELADVVERWLGHKQTTMLPHQMQMLKKYLTEPMMPKTKVAVPTSDGLEFIEINDIVRCESESNYTWLHMQDGAVAGLPHTQRSGAGNEAQWFYPHPSFTSDQPPTYPQIYPPRWRGDRDGHVASSLYPERARTALSNFLRILTTFKQQVQKSSYLPLVGKTSLGSGWTLPNFYTKTAFWQG